MIHLIRAAQRVHIGRSEFICRHKQNTSARIFHKGAAYCRFLLGRVRKFAVFVHSLARDKANIGIYALRKFKCFLTGTNERISNKQASRAIGLYMISAQKLRRSYAIRYNDYIL
jgi:hypothetical protein